MIKLFSAATVLTLAMFLTALGLTRAGDKYFKIDKFDQAKSNYQLAKKIFPFGINYEQRELALSINKIDRSGPAEESGDDLPINYASNVLGVSVHVPVLMYHYIRVNPVASDKVGYNLSVTPDNFNAQMDYLASHGYSVITLDDLGGALFSHGSLPSKPIAITFDDGYADSYWAAYPVLKSHNFKALNFIITGLVGAPNYLTWGQIEEMKNSGVFTFGAHTVHHYALAYLNNQRVKSEIVDSKNVLLQHLGVNTNWFAYPYGSVDGRVVNITKQAGLAGAFGTNSGSYQSTDYLFTLPRIRVGGGDTVSSFAAKLPWR